MTGRKTMGRPLHSWRSGGLDFQVESQDEIDPFFSKVFFVSGLDSQFCKGIIKQSVSSSFSLPLLSFLVCYSRLWSSAFILPLTWEGRRKNSWSGRLLSGFDDSFLKTNTDYMSRRWKSQSRYHLTSPLETEANHVTKKRFSAMIGRKESRGLKRKTKRLRKKRRRKIPSLWPTAVLRRREWRETCPINPVNLFTKLSLLHRIVVVTILF